MPDDSAAIVRYLQPPPASFWRWDDHGRSLTWAAGGGSADLGGETVAFREELLAVLRRLADRGNGLPPFAAVVLLQAATRDNWPVTSPRLAAHPEGLVESGNTGHPGGHIMRFVGGRPVADTAALVMALEAVAALPADLRRSPTAKATLAEVVFERTTGSPHPPAAGVVAELEAGTDPSAFERTAGTSAVREWVDVLDTLRPGLADLTVDRLAARLRTGLDAPVRPADADLGPGDRARLLMARPSDDPDLSAVTRIARGLLAAVAVPRPVGEPDDRPAGGVSDLSNRGPLDRLLLSELAHDDLTLAVRVAVNEALYLQRETPPREPPRRRAILVDTGLRTWGVPRVCAAAVALALTATADPGEDVAAHRPGPGPSLVLADLTTRSGLMAHLAALDGRAHFGDALPAFAAAADGAEPFLVTQADVLDDVEFQRALRDHGPASAYAAAVGRDGSFRLWHLAGGGRRLVRSAQLDLDALLGPPRAPRPALPLLDPTGDEPIILSVHPFPLRLPPTSPVRAVTEGAKGAIVGVTADRRLLAHDPVTAGARQLTDRLPTGRVECLSITRDGETVAAFHDGGQLRRAVHWPVSDRTEVVPLAVDFGPQEVLERDGLLYVLGRGTAAVFDLISADPLGRTSTAGRYRRRVRGRLFSNGGKSELLVWDGSRLAFEPVPALAGQADRVFEWAGHEGPLVIGPAGEVTAAGVPTKPLWPGTGRSVWVVGVSPDGARLVVRAFKPEAWFRLDLTADRAWVEGKGYETPERLVAWLRPRAGTPTAWRTPSLRTRFHGVLVDAAGTLTLVGGGAARDVRLAGPNLDLAYRRATLYVGSPQDTRVRRFGRPARPDGVGYALRTAAWTDGSRATLDSRGLLHLRSADRSVPEVTLLLDNDGPLAGWSSDGRAYGPFRYHGQPTSADAKMLDALVRRFTGPLR